MGVTGLWKLIESSGKPVPLETLENKVLAIDISIWLHQVVKGYQDNKGGHLLNAHLLGLFNRICKLLYFRIKPIFVFDGSVPELKRQTIAKRAQQKTKIQSEAERLEHLLLESLAREKIVLQALGDPEKLVVSPTKYANLKASKQNDVDDIFKLPENVERIKFEVKDEDDLEEEDSCPKRSYDVNINQIDLKSSHFQSLPADIRHEILFDIKETRKQNSWARLRELPVEAPDFSSYQMSRLLKRRQVQVSLEEAEKEMGGKTWTLSELETLLSEDGVLDDNSKHFQKIASNENTRFMLVRDIALAMKEVKKEPLKPTTALSSQPSTSSSFQPSTSDATEPSTSKSNVQVIDCLDDDEDLDLQRALQLSLGNDPGVQENEEFEDDPDMRVKLNAKQRQKFGETIQTHGLIRGFMMEYAQMNDDEIKDLMESTQQETPNVEDVDPYRAKFPNTDASVLYGSPEKGQKPSPENVSKESNVSKSKASQNEIIAIESDSDDDFVEVQSESEPAKPDQKTVIIVDPKSTFNKDDDLFADVFDNLKNKSFQAKESEVEDKVLDVEVASISSDDDTLSYDIPVKDFTDVEEELQSNHEGTTGNSLQLIEVIDEPTASENEKFWSSFEDSATDVQTSNRSIEVLQQDLDNQKQLGSTDEDKTDMSEITKDIVEVSTEDVLERSPDLSKNEEFWSCIEETEPHVEQEPIEHKTKLLDGTKTVDELITTPVKEASPPPSKIPSPFFVNQTTPKSNEKNNIDVAPANGKEVVKSLFADPKNVVQELREKNTTEQLEKMKNQLVNDQKSLAQERNKFERMGASITESMCRDCKDLLRLFGIPYVDAPMEAEAQCAFLDAMDLTNGTISDDSDIWLFGGQTVYKNFFVQKKIVMEFRNESIEEMFHLDRKKLIQLAMLVGSDYTVGINGVGAVTALEILAAFPSITDNEEGVDQYQSLVSSLRKFREWWTTGKQAGPGGKTVLKSKLKNIELFEGFPNLNVARAYLEPTIDTSTDKFSWGLPDNESLVEYAKTKLGWTRNKTEEILAPVMKRLNERKQATIKDYFKSQVTKKFFDSNKMSKRVQKAVTKMGGVEEEEPESEELKKPRKRQPRKKKEKSKEATTDEGAEKIDLVESDEEPSSKPAETESLINQPSEEASTSRAKKPKSNPSTSKSEKDLFKPQAKKATRGKRVKESSALEDPVPVKRVLRIPETKQVIPQREKDKEEQEKAKQKAIDLFKSKRAGAKK